MQWEKKFKTIPMKTGHLVDPSLSLRETKRHVLRMVLNYIIIELDSKTIVDAFSSL